MKFIQAAIVLTTVILTVGNAHAQQSSETSSRLRRPLAYTETSVPHIGILAGYVVPEGNLDATASFGLDIGFQPIVPFSTGAELTFFRAEGEENNELERTQLLFKGQYNFGGDIPIVKNSYVGLGAGAATNGDEVSLVSAPIIGFDIRLSDSPRDFVSLGLNAKYSITEGGEPDAFNVAGAVKYWY